MKEIANHKVEFIFTDDLGKDIFTMFFDGFKTPVSITKFYLLLMSNNPDYSIRIGSIKKTVIKNG